MGWREMQASGCRSKLASQPFNSQDPSVAVGQAIEFWASANVITRPSSFRNTRDLISTRKLDSLSTFSCSIAASFTRHTAEHVIVPAANSQLCYSCFSSMTRISCQASRSAQVCRDIILHYASGTGIVVLAHTHGSLPKRSGIELGEVSR